jgi:hypothetical protein
MKPLFTLLSLILHLSVLGQSDTLMDVELKNVKTDVKHSYFTFDSVPDLASKTIVIKYLWTENEKLEKSKELVVGFQGAVLAEPKGPKNLLGEEILGRGTRAGGNSLLIEGIELPEGFEMMRVDYYYLKEVNLK